MSDLLRKFEATMCENYHVAKDELGYDAKKYAQMLRTIGAVETAKTLINQNAPTSGFERLWNKGKCPRLDLSVEATVIDNPEFHCLFDAETLKKARFRLRQFNYQPNACPNPEKPN